MHFYMGTIWIQGRADLSVIYIMIFRRLKLLGADWAYSFPEIHLVSLSSLRAELKEPSLYSPSEGWKASQEEEQHQAEVEKMQAELNEINIRSRKEALDCRYHPPYGGINMCTAIVHAVGHQFSRGKGTMKKDLKKEMYGLCFRCEYRAEYLNKELNAGENEYVGSPRCECSMATSVAFMLYVQASKAVYFKGK